MAKLLHLSRPSRGVRNVVRIWLALRAQKRRRKAAAGPSGPTAPGNLLAEDCGTFIRLTWQDRSSDEQCFRVYRNGTLYATVPAGGQEYDDYGVLPQVPYTYYVVAVNAGGESAHSNEASVTFGA